MLKKLQGLYCSQFSLICLTLVCLSVVPVKAQSYHLEISTPVVHIDGTAFAEEFCGPNAAAETYNANAVDPGYPHADFGVFRFIQAKADGGFDCILDPDRDEVPGDFFFCQFTPSSEVTSTARAHAYLDGNLSASVGFGWEHQAKSKAHVATPSCCLDPCVPTCFNTNYNGDVTSELTVSFELTVHTSNGGGAFLNFNTAQWRTEWSTPEAGAEDWARAPVYEIRIDGAPVIPQSAVTMSVLDGQVISVELESTLEAHISSPGNPSGCKIVDFANAQFDGKIDIQLDGAPLAVPPPPIETPCFLDCSFPLFSLDIGSDKELSDPNPIGNEYFDPGDMYTDMGTIPPLGGENGLQDDSEIFLGVDFAPSTPDPVFPPASAAPVGQLQFVPDFDKDFFDLDGSDNLSFALSTQSYGPGAPSLYFPSAPCLFEPEFLLLSMDDDKAPHYMNNLVQSVPATESSPEYTTHGQAVINDEIVGWNLGFSPYGLPIIVSDEYGLSDEEWLHSQLGPSPLPFLEGEDDDVDALDLPIAFAGCDVWYFSADHEAPGTDPNSGDALEAGVIYEVTPAGPIPVVEPGLHLGIPDEVDIDAFEFVSLYDAAQLRNGLALLFSVDEDDPFTFGQDESAGLDPTVIYYSFLNGSFDVFLDNTTEDIDAIAAWHCPLDQFAIYGKPDARLYVGQREFYIGSDASSIAFFVGNSAPHTNLNWNATTTDWWIPALPSGGGPGYATIFVDENTSGLPRTGTVEITANGSCPSIIITIHQSDIPKRGADKINATVDAHLLTPQPHPIEESARFGFVLNRKADITLAIFDLSGRRVGTVAEGNFDSGEHLVDWNNREVANSLSSGVYELRLEVRDGANLQTLRQSITILR